jgi:hypothetical protein
MYPPTTTRFGGYWMARPDPSSTPVVRTRAIVAAIGLALLTVTAVPALADGDGASEWEQRAELVPDHQTEDLGESLAVDDGTVLAGAPSEGETGAAYVFAGSVDDPDVTRLVPSPAVDEDVVSFGTAVALEDGTAVVGDPEDPGQQSARGGAFYVFGPTTGGWEQTDAVTPPADEEQDNSQFAENVELEGDTLFVSAHAQDTDTGEDTGVVYVYDVGGGTATFEQRIDPSPVASGAHFGTSLAVDGSTALVGANLDDTASVDSAGTVYVLAEDPKTGEWSQVDAFDAPSPENREEFGAEVDLDGSQAIVSTSPIAGTAYVYADDGSGFSHEQTILDGEASFVDFATTDAVAIDGDRLVVTGNSNLDSTTSAFVFERGADGWERTAEIGTLDANRGGFALNVGVEVVDDRIYGGAPDLSSQQGGPNAGAVLVFEPCQPSGPASSAIDEVLVGNLPNETGAQDPVEKANCQYVQELG